jgi:hypothetical protein
MRVKKVSYALGAIGLAPIAFAVTAPAAPAATAAHAAKANAKTVSLQHSRMSLVRASALASSTSPDVGGTCTGSREKTFTGMGIATHFWYKFGTGAHQTSICIGTVTTSLGINIGSESSLRTRIYAQSAGGKKLMKYSHLSRGSSSPFCTKQPQSLCHDKNHFDTHVKRWLRFEPIQICTAAVFAPGTGHLIRGPICGSIG